MDNDSVQAKRAWMHDNPNDPRHGTVNGYNNLRCRCDRCRTAATRHHAEDKKVRQSKPIPGHVHGTENGYGNWGCRCLHCTSVWSAASMERRRRRIQRGGKP